MRVPETTGQAEAPKTYSDLPQIEYIKRTVAFE